MSKEEIINNFDPNGVGELGSLFGLPFTTDQADIIVIPVPWEVTVSYGSGTVDGPVSVLEASPQLDLYMRDVKDAWKLGVAMQVYSERWAEESENLRTQAEKYILWLEEGAPSSKDENLKAVVEIVNEASSRLNKWVKDQATAILAEGKIPVVLGGDHSTPLGLMQALGDKHEEGFGILQIDAHADLRDAYEGFEYSHASIMFNALKIENVSKLVQVGIRDYCEDEADLVDQSNGRIHTFYDKHIKEMLYEGDSWKSICELIVEQLPQKVYISFDIDGLDPKLCPNTGTPVPGGFDFEEAMFLVKTLVRSGREIIGLDLCEVSPSATNAADQWDGNVGARVLYNLVNYMGVSQGKLEFT